MTMTFSLYNKLLLIFIIIPLFPMVVVSFYMEPVTNELTGLGGYLENDYGWNSPQEYFKQPLFKKASSIENYQQYYDVVVVGDSFSANESYGWLNYFGNRSGLTIIFFNMNFVALDEVINSPVYQNKPPKLFIYESIERNIIDRHGLCDTNNFSINKKFTIPQIDIKPLGMPVVKISRNRKIKSVETHFSSTVNYLKKAVMRNLLGINITEVHRFELTRAGLFSSKENDAVLVITRDFQLKGVTDEQVETAKCSLLSLQNRIRRNNTTEFIALVFPDKTTVYSDYLRDRSYADMSIVKKIENTKGLNIVPLVENFKQAVKNGVVDFYLPSDTHCGFYAYKMAADAVLTLLNELRGKNTS